MALEPSDRQQVLAWLREAGRLSGVAEVTFYEGHLDDPDGGTVRVTIRICDLGPTAGPGRWTVEATDERGRTATGNPHVTLEDTIDLVHWGALRRPAE